MDHSLSIAHCPHCRDPIPCVAWPGWSRCGGKSGKSHRRAASRKIACSQNMNSTRLAMRGQGAAQILRNTDLIMTRCSSRLVEVFPARSRRKGVYAFLYSTLQEGSLSPAAPSRLHCRPWLRPAVFLRLLRTCGTRWLLTADEAATVCAFINR